MSSRGWPFQGERLCLTEVPSQVPPPLCWDLGALQTFGVKHKLCAVMTGMVGEAGQIFEQEESFVDSFW